MQIARNDGTLGGLALLLAVAACGTTAGPAAEPTPGEPTDAPAGTAPDAADAPPGLEWQWTGEDPGFGQSFYSGPVTAGDATYQCVFTYDDEAHRAAVGCESTAGGRWTRDSPDAFLEDAALGVRDGVLYDARYSDIATGCTVTAYDAASGDLLWSTRLQGLGPVGHSEYLNKVELQVLADGRIALFGWESAGRYVEVLDRITGQTVSNRVLDTAP